MQNFDGSSKAAGTRGQQDGPQEPVSGQVSARRAAGGGGGGEGISAPAGDDAAGVSYHLLSIRV